MKYLYVRCLPYDEVDGLLIGEQALRGVMAKHPAIELLERLWDEMAPDGGVRQYAFSHVVFNCFGITYLTDDGPLGLGDAAYKVVTRREYWRDCGENCPTGANMNLQHDGVSFGIELLRVGGYAYSEMVPYDVIEAALKEIADG